MCGFGSDDEFSCNVCVELIVFVEADAVDAASAVEDLKGDLAGDLGLAEDFYDGLDTFEDLALDDCFEGYATRELEDAAPKATVAERFLYVCDECSAHELAKKSKKVSSAVIPIHFINNDHLNLRHVSRISSWYRKVIIVVHISTHRATAPVSPISTERGRPRPAPTARKVPIRTSVSAPSIFISTPHASW